MNPRIADSHYGEMIHLIGLETTPVVDAACLFLEGMGLRFCIDYGTDNALTIAESYPEWDRICSYRWDS